MAEDIASISATALQNTRSLERQGLQRIEAQLSGLERRPQYRSALEVRKRTGEKHLARLDEAAGREDPASEFRTSAEEDRTSAEAVDGMIESVTRATIGLATSGHRADR